MGVLRVNHGVKGIVAWIFPTEDGIRDVTGRLATVLSGEEVVSYTLGAPRIGLETGELLDVSVWIKDGSALVSIVHLGYSDRLGEIEVLLPEGLNASGVEATLYGVDGWVIEGHKLRKAGVKALEISIFKISYSG